MPDASTGPDDMHPPTEGDEGIGARLRAAREHRHLSTARAALMLGTDAPMLAAWESDERTPDALQLRAAAELYMVTSEALLWGGALTTRALWLARSFDMLREDQRTAIESMFALLTRN